MSEEEDDNASKFSEGDARKDRGAHVDDGVVGASDTRPLGRDGEGTCNVRAKLDRDPDGHHEVHQRDGIERNMPQIHKAKHVDNNHGDSEKNKAGGVEVEP